MSLRRFLESDRRINATAHDRDLGRPLRPILDDIKELLDHVNQNMASHMTEIPVAPNAFRAKGFKTEVTSDTFPGYVSVIFVGHEDITNTFVVDERIKYNDKTRLREVYKIGDTTLDYFRDDLKPIRLTKGSEDRELISHLRSLIADVQNHMDWPPGATL